MSILKDIYLFSQGRRRDCISFNGEPVGSYSQRGEDLIIDGILKGKAKGYYVDIGANHPTALSNTYRFYQRGWKGICIEPNPMLFNLFWDKRQFDTVLNCGVGLHSGSLPFYLVSSHSLSSFSKEDATRNCRIHDERLTDVVDICVWPLKDILDKYKPEHIDFMSIDTEGYEMQVLESNDWVRYSPDVVCIEIENEKERIFGFLNERGYQFVFGNGCNGIFVRGGVE